MKRIIVLLALLMAWPAHAHVGSPDVFFEGSAGPYKLFVTVRMPQVIPGIASIEIRAADADVRTVTVVPMRLTGPGSDLAPVPDRAARDSRDPQQFSADLWLMEFGSLRVRIDVDGGRGPAQLSVPIAARAQRTLPMQRGLGTLLFALMCLLAVALISIAGAAFAQASAAPGSEPPPKQRRAGKIAAAIASVVVVALIVIGKLWWDSEAAQYARWIERAAKLEPTLTGCELALPAIDATLLPDHGHPMHLFMIRGDLAQVAHLHPVRASTDAPFTQQLPSLRRGHYTLFADVVYDNGYPSTRIGELDLAADLACAPPVGDDAAWSAGAATAITYDGPTTIRAGVATKLHVKVNAASIEPYMGMAGHAAVVKSDLSVFAHLHPDGSVAMPALALAGTNTMTHAPALPPEVAFPYGFPSPGEYHVFVQVKVAGTIDTGAFTIHVTP